MTVGSNLVAGAAVSSTAFVSGVVEQISLPLWAAPLLVLPISALVWWRLGDEPAPDEQQTAPTPDDVDITPHPPRIIESAAPATNVDDAITDVHAAPGSVWSPKRNTGSIGHDPYIEVPTSGERKQVEDILAKRPASTFLLPQRQRRQPGEPLGQPDLDAIRAAALRQLRAPTPRDGRRTDGDRQAPLPSVTPHIKPGWASSFPATAEKLRAYASSLG